LHYALLFCLIVTAKKLQHFNSRMFLDNPI